MLQLEKTTSDRKLLSVRELAEQLGVSADWVYSHLDGQHQPQLPVVRLGRHVRFRPEDIERWLDGQRKRSQTE